jgi:NAD(P) transhydrogenase
VACGTRPAHDPNIPCDGKYIFDADQILNLSGARRPRSPSQPPACSIIAIFSSFFWVCAAEMPRNLIVVGAGVVGIEYAAMLGSLANTQVTVIDQRPELLEFVDREIVDNLVFHMREARGKFRLGEKVSIPPPHPIATHGWWCMCVGVCVLCIVCIVYCVYCVVCVPEGVAHPSLLGYRVQVKNVKVDEARKRVIAELESGKRVIGDSLLYAVGRQCNSDSLNLAAAGLTADARGTLVSHPPAPTPLTDALKPGRAPEGERALPNGGAAHLCRRRRDRLPVARVVVDAAGPLGRVSHVGPTVRPRAAQPHPLRHLLYSPPPSSHTPLLPASFRS